MKAFWYRGYGLGILSGITLPEFLPGRAEAAADIRVEIAPDAERQFVASGGAGVPGRFVAAPEGGFVMRVDGVADYWVRDGCWIGIAPAAGCEPAALRLFLIGSAMGMALHQRGALVLHGATVLGGAGATIFVGESGAGKSTLAARLAGAGLPILGDDTMPLWPRPGGGFEVWPGSRMFKLWADTLAGLGQPVEGLESVGTRADKFFVPGGAGAPDRPAPLLEVIELVRGPGGPALEPLAGLEALRMISEQTYRPEYVSLLDAAPAHFQLCSKVAGAVRCWRLSRPWDAGRIGETIDLLRAHWAALPAGAAR